MYSTNHDRNYMCNPVGFIFPPLHIFIHRHWQQLSEELGLSVQPKPTLTFSKCLEMGLEEHKETITKVADVAGKEYSIEQV